MPILRSTNDHIASVVIEVHGPENIRHQVTNAVREAADRLAVFAMLGCKITVQAECRCNLAWEQGGWISTSIVMIGDKHDKGSDGGSDHQ